MPKIILITHNIRSTHNVGSILRTAEGLAVDKVYLTGYTPYPTIKNDDRLPHLARKINNQIAKTSLGAEKLVNLQHENNIFKVIDELRKSSYQIYALEQADKSINIINFNPPEKVALIVGNEVNGLDSAVLKSVDQILEIPMHGKKESFNVAVATGIALYHINIKR